MAMIIDMPKLSDTMTVGTLVRWLKEEGEAVQSGDMIAEVETDKATMELENFEDGILLKRYIAEGSQVPVGSAICAIGAEGEKAPEAPVTPAEESAPEEKPKTPAPAPVPTPKSQVAAAQAQAPSPAAVEVNGRLKASPLARKIAAERGIHLASIQGSGPGGRIVRADVEHAVSGGSVSVQLEAKTIPVTNMRSTIARLLVQSKTQSPHFYLDIEVDAAPLMETRAGINKKFVEQGKPKLTVNDFILKAAAAALVEVPEINASWGDEAIQQHGTVNLAFGVAVDEGLVTPVIRDAHLKTLQQISTDAKSYIAKARDRKLTPEEMSGSTFTVTNLGMFGVQNFFGIINPPNAGILSVGGTVQKPVVNAAGEITVGQCMMLGFSGDHRVIDGANGALFLKSMKEILETPALMLIS